MHHTPKLSPRERERRQRTNVLPARAQLRQSQAQAASAEAKHPGSSSEGGTAAAQLGDSGVTAHSTARKISGGQDSVPEHHRHPPAQAAARPFGASFAVVEPETPSPVNRRDPLAPDSSCSSSDEEVSFERGRKRSLESSRGYEAAALAAARARAADDRAALAEAALAAAQDRASAAEAAHTESLTESARQALRIAELEKQLLEMQLKLSSSEGAARGGGCDRGAESQHTSIVDSAHSAGTAPAVGGAAAQQDQDGGNDTEDDAENAEPMDLWPPPGLRGCELDFCADGEAAADAERAARLTEQVTALETDVESQSERLTAAFARMAAMCDMVQGAAKIAFSGNDLSARRLRHHIFQCAPSAARSRMLPVAHR